MLEIALNRGLFGNKYISISIQLPRQNAIMPNTAVNEAMPREWAVENKNFF
jgi:hypothetical protein